MTMHSTTKRLRTTAAALSLGLLLCGSLAMAAEAPAATPSTTPPVESYPQFTPEERRQHWEHIQQSARDLWTTLVPTAEEREHYWEQMKKGWHNLVAMINPPAAEAPTAAAITAEARELAAAAPEAAGKAVAKAPEAAKKVASEASETARKVAARASETATKVAAAAPAAAQEVAAEARTVSHKAIAGASEVEAAAVEAAAAPAVTSSLALPAAATHPPMKSHAMWTLWGMTPEQRKQYWEYMQRGY